MGGVGEPDDVADGDWVERGGADRFVVDGDERGQRDYRAERRGRGQWCDLVIGLQTAANQFDDLALASAVATLAGYVDTEVAAILAAVDTEIAAIKAKTDNLPSDPADDSDIDAQLAVIAGYLDTEIAAILAAVDTEIAAIKAKTDNLPASPAAVGSAMTLAADAVNSASLAASAVAEIQAGLSTLTAGQVNAEVVDALSVDGYAEPGSVPPATASLVDKLGWLFMLARNKRLTTATADKVRNDADSGDVATATLSDDGTTFTRGSILVGGQESAELRVTSDELRDGD